MAWAVAARWGAGSLCPCGRRTPMTKFDRLLAKSRRVSEPWHDSMWLPVHLEDAYRAAGQVVDATGEDQLKALRLEPGRYLERFRRIVLLAAATHDLGKANDHFQGMIHG